MANEDKQRQDVGTSRDAWNKKDPAAKIVVVAFTLGISAAFLAAVVKFILWLF